MAGTRSSSLALGYATTRSTARRTSKAVALDRYADEVLSDLRAGLLARVSDLVAAGTPLPPPEELAGLLAAVLPHAAEELDPHYADIGPFYNSDGALHQLGGITKQALASRRDHHTVLAMRSGDGTWLYPAWQFTGAGGVHPVLRPVLGVLRSMDRWAAGVWMVSAHPDLRGVSPRQALRSGVDPDQVAELAVRDSQQLVG